MFARQPYNRRKRKTNYPHPLVFSDVCLLKMAAELQNEVKTQQMEENKENSIDESLGLESILTVNSLVIS